MEVGTLSLFVLYRKIHIFTNPKIFSHRDTYIDLTVSAHVNVVLSAHVSVVLSAHVNVVLSAHVSVVLSAHVNVVLSAHVSVVLSAHVNVVLSAHVSVVLSAHVNVVLSAHVNVVLSAHVNVVLSAHVNVVLSAHVNVVLSAHVYVVLWPHYWWCCQLSLEILCVENHWCYCYHCKSDHSILDEKRSYSPELIFKGPAGEREELVSEKRTASLQGTKDPPSNLSLLVMITYFAFPPNILVCDD